MRLVVAFAVAVDPALWLRAVLDIDYDGFAAEVAKEGIPSTLPPTPFSSHPKDSKYLH
jgi:hypothetical protein